MKRIIGAVVGAVVLSAVAFLPFGSAGAAPNQTEHFKFHGDVAEAAWSRGSVDTFVGVQNTKTGTELFLDQTTSTSTGFTDLFVDVSSGFTFTIASKLSNASLTATNVSATRCTFDNDFNEIGCNATTINVSVSWTGQGAVVRETSNDHIRFDGVSINDHFNGTTRNADASGVIGGVTFSANDLIFADIAHVNQGETVVCHGGSCA